MNKLTKRIALVFSSSAIACATIAAFRFAALSTKASGESAYALAFNPGGSSTVNTVNGNPISFQTVGLSGNIMSNGDYILNDTPITGISSIDFSYSAGSSVTLNLYPGADEGNGLVYADKGIPVTLDSNEDSASFSFAEGSFPKYLKIESAGDLTLNSLVFHYTCAPDAHRRILPTAEEVLRHMRSFLGYSKETYTVSSTTYNGRASRVLDLVNAYCRGHGYSTLAAKYSPLYVIASIIAAGGGELLDSIQTGSTAFASSQRGYTTDLTSYVPQKGDIVTHNNDGTSVALVDEVDGDTIYVLEGNNSRSVPNSAQTKAGLVSRLALTKGDLTSYSRPAYATDISGVGAQDVLSVMRGWMGIREADNRHQEIIDIYDSISPLPRTYTVQYDDEWCDTTVSAASIVAGATHLTSRECGVQVHASVWYNQFPDGWHPMEELYDYNGSSYAAWQTGDPIYTLSAENPPMPGDIILYDWGNNNDGTDDHHADHIGYVESVDTVNQNILTIEGNTSTRVYQRLYGYSSNKWAGYFRPAYTSNRARSGRELLNVIRSYLGDEYAYDSADATGNSRLLYLTDALDTRLRIDPGSGNNYSSSSWRTDLGEYRYAAYALVSALYVSGLAESYGIDIPLSYNKTTTKAFWDNAVNCAKLRTLFDNAGHWHAGSSYVPNPGDILGYGTTAGSLNRYAIVDTVKDGKINAIALNNPIVGAHDSNGRAIEYLSFAVGSPLIDGYASLD